MNRKKWVVSPCDRELAADIAENCGIEPFAALLLCSRGLTDEFEVESFLFDTELIDPFTLPDMEIACERVHKAVDSGERITVFGDYDADGVTSTALMYSFLSSRGAVVDYYIPDRADEGYGMNNRAIDSLKERGTGLIVTVDNGISAIDEIEYAKSLGIDVVVTDHHKVGEVLPDAVAVVDPHREDSVCEFSEWAGVGVAFKFICAFDNDFGYDLLEEYGDLVALGTVADIVSLRSENRIIVRSGLAFINAGLHDGTLRTGMKALIEACDNSGAINSTGLAFRLSPRINAAGRLGSAERALKLLLSEDEEEARLIAEEISQLNSQRQSTEGAITEEAIKIIENNDDIKYRKVIVVSGDGWHQGVIGIVASRVAEKYGKPCIVISENDNVSRGSGRSIEGFSLYDALSYCSGTLVQYGGHVLAAGLSIDKDKIPEFRDKINEYAETLEPIVGVLHIDCKLNPAGIDVDMVSSLQILEPYGAENPQPLFGLYGMYVSGIQSVGNGKHTRLSLKKNGISLSAIMFSVAPEALPYVTGDKVDAAVKLSENEYMGKTQVSVQVKDIRLSGYDEDKIIASERLYEDFCKGKEDFTPFMGKIIVDRAFCGDVYRYIKNNGGWRYSSEFLCYRLGLSEERLADCNIALDVLSELGIIILKEGKYILPSENIKVSLENSSVFRRACKCRNEQ
ncbi:MAG: single-stranded-DNA-specific exonuclease RecJ [Clostridia bacterium]|nr:single-stranded-DNA-specific exonuclease RecJ [Clostridia bacterium]